MTNQRSADYPWQHDHLADAVVSSALELPRVRLSQCFPDPGPAAYLMFLGHEISDLPLWRPFVGLCSYAGSAADASDRMARHRRSLVGTALSADHLWVAIQPASSHAWALYLEAVHLDRLRPAWCDRRLRGWGSRTRGHRREGGRNTAWDSLFPGRQWSRLPTSEEAAVAALDVINFLGDLRPQPTWAPLPAE